jgi:hypothetical protein
VNETKGLLVVPKHGRSYPVQYLVNAERIAQKLANQGRGPVQIISRFTGDTFATFEQEEVDVEQTTSV